MIAYISDIGLVRIKIIVLCNLDKLVSRLSGKTKYSYKVLQNLTRQELNEEHFESKKPNDNTFCKIYHVQKYQRNSSTPVYNLKCGKTMSCISTKSDVRINMQTKHNRFAWRDKTN